MIKNFKDMSEEERHFIIHAFTQLEGDDKEKYIKTYQDSNSDVVADLKINGIEANLFEVIHHVYSYMDELVESRAVQLIKERTDEKYNDFTYLIDSYMEKFKEDMITKLNVNVDNWD